MKNNQIVLIGMRTRALQNVRKCLTSKYLAVFLTIICLSFINTDVKATHAVGGEISYTADTVPNRYKIKLSIYRDCNGINLSNNQIINISGTSFNTSASLTRTSLTDISLLCPGQVSSCNNQSGAFGTEEHIYEGTITLPPGGIYRVSRRLCCRPNAITTMTSPGGEALYLETIIDNSLTVMNNSPSFLSPPIAVYCINQTASVSLGASDVDGDSLSYSLIDARENFNDPVEYAAPFSGLNPISSSTPVTINPITGQISFTPNTSQVAVFAILVEEYRAGVKIGEIARDLQVRVINCGGNTTPTIATVANTTANVGQQLCIPIVASDVDGDMVTLSVSSGIIPAPSFVIDSTVAGATYGTFCYTPSINDSGSTFTISISANDDFCPVPASAASSFNIEVLIPCNVSSSISSVPALCGNPVGSATATLSGGVAPYSYSWSGAATGNTQTINNLSPGTYYVSITDGYGCTATDSVDILYSGSVIALGGFTNDATCGLNNGSITLNASNGNAPYSYSLNGGMYQSGNTFSSLAPGIYNMTVTDNTTCTTTASFTVSNILDTTPPVANCKNYSLTLSGGVGTVSPSDVNNMSTDNCGITSMMVMPNSFTCADAGINTVMLIVQDAQGNADTCTADVTIQDEPTCTISATPANNTYTGGVPTNLYLGYGPLSATLNTSTTGNGNFTYSWSPSAGLSNANVQNPVFTPTTAGNFTFTLTATNSNGCATTCDITFCVIDVRVPGKKGKASKKVYLCHAPPGNPSNSHLLSISKNAVSSHLNNHSGDKLGPCSYICGTSNKNSGSNGLAAIEIPDDGMTYKVYPNPANGNFNLYVASMSEELATAVVHDMTGRQMLTINNIDLFTTVSFGENFSPGVYVISVTQGKVKKSIQIVKSK